VFKEKSLITISLLASRGHWDEYDLHIKAAISNGIKKEEIAEALFHVAIYAGVPAANTAFKRAKNIF
jgi:alkylhydroperoxidase/carboxymuconolactone decarboxylase family protein YurZ